MQYFYFIYLFSANRFMNKSYLTSALLLILFLSNSDLMSQNHFERAHSHLKDHSEEDVIRFTDSIAINQSNSKFYYWRGVRYLRCGKLQEALNDCNTAIKLADSSEYYLQRAEIYVELRKIKEASADIDYLIINGTNYAMAYYLKALTINSRNVNVNSIKYFKEAIKKDSLFPSENVFFHYFYAKDFWCDYGYAMREISDLVNADKAYKMALNSAAKNELTSMEYKTWADINYKLKDYYKAIKLCNKGIDKKQDDYGLYLLRGLCKTELNDLRGSILDFEVMAKNQPNTVVYLMLGESQMKLNMTAEALASFSKSIELDGQQGTAYYYRGLVRLGLKQKNLGCLDLSKAGELGVKEAYSMINMLCY